MQALQRRFGDDVDNTKVNKMIPPLLLIAYGIYHILGIEERIKANVLKNKRKDKILKG